MDEQFLQNILIVSFSPYFLEKDFFWFEKNLQHILKAAKNQKFWQENILFLEKEQKISLSETLRKIDEMGYEKVFQIEAPGEFSHLGGMIEIFPINCQFAIKIDFLGNSIESIEKNKLLKAEEKQSRILLKNKLKRQEVFGGLKNLRMGDYLTHLDHGIGRFVGIADNKFSVANGPIINKEQISQLSKENYYVLQYGKNDKLYVPIGLERKLSVYLGFSEPKLNSLNSWTWQKTKKKAKEDALKTAKELLNIFAEKEISQREPYFRDELFESLEQNFAFELTPDQKQALKEIRQDMLGKKPMDRLICGDVGFGKTEIALRTSALTGENSRQTAIIVPTAILAKQHFNTFQKRLSLFPFNVAILTRLENQKTKRENIAKIKSGQIDIVIGTHSLLSDKIIFKNLGLLIIDDEQKFGVKQKEKFRAKYPFLDVLSLSATPIPRTMYLALSALKKISFVLTPPEGRKSIKTIVAPFSKKAIKKAIESELSRNGQVYFLHNRINTMDNLRQMINELKKEAKIKILHAKLPEKEIVSIMDDFSQGKIDILLSTTIIENGIDITNANTLIVDDAAKLGLSQAYQLRGRVGRGNKQSFAYFFFGKKTLKGLAKKRLKALKEAQELGSGYKIATRDMEIRGAGNILGKEQSGNVNKIGLNLYCQMLSEAVEKLNIG